MGRLITIPLALLALVALSVLWSGGGARQRAEFRFINRGDIFTLNLNDMSYLQDFRLTYAIREGLYGVEPSTLRPIPAGATGYDLSDDKRVWTFHLRPGCVWTNGDPVTAKDYVFSWRRMLEEPGEYTYLFFYIRGAQRYSEGLQDYFAWYENEDRKAEPAKFARGLKAYDAAMSKFAKENPPPEPLTDEYKQKRDSFESALIKNLVENQPPRPDFGRVGVEVPDDLTLRVTLNDPVPYLLELISFPPFYPRNERSMEPFKTPLNDQDGHHTYRGDYTRPSPGNGRPGVVTNGPYVLDKWEFKQRLLLVKSQSYWDKDNVKTNSIEMVVNDNPLSQFLHYERGLVDWMADVPADLAPELRVQGRTDLQISPAFGTSFLTLMIRPNLPASILGGAKNPLADVRVRQALAMSIDKRFLVENITRMGEMPARTYLPPDGTLPSFRWKPGPYDSQTQRVYDDKQMREMLTQPDAITRPDGPGLPFDITKARKLLADAGYPNGEGFPRLPLLFNTDSTTRAKVVQVLKNQWKQNLNIDVDIVGIEGRIYKDRVHTKEYAIAPAGWYGDYPDVSTFTDKYLTGGGNNDSDYRNPQYDGLCEQATREPDLVKRIAMLSAAENMLDTEVPIIPLYHLVNTGLARGYVHGVEPNPRSVTIFKGLRIDSH